MFVGSIIYNAGGGQRLLFKMTGTAVVLQLISFFFCCGKSLGKADIEPKRFASARSVVLMTKPTRSDKLHGARAAQSVPVTKFSPLFSLLFLLIHCLTAVSGAYLQYGSARLFDSPTSVTLTVGASERVYCVQATGPVPTSIEWYNPQGQLVSKDVGDAVNQRVAGGGS